jgi:hypothetical protein
MFGPMKGAIRRKRRFSSDEEVIGAKLVKRWNRCVEVEGD